MAESPRLDRRRARIAARGVGESRRFQRVALPLEGRFLAPDEVEHPCRLTDLSPGGARVETDRRLHPGALTVIHIEHFGHLEAEIVRHTQDGFSVRWLAGPRRRERLAEQLVWRYNAPRLGLCDDRGGPRDKRRGAATVIFGDGAEVRAGVVDVSPTGISFRSNYTPRLGAPARLGRLSGEVSRLTPDGFAIRFDPPARGETQPPQSSGADAV